MGDRSTGSTADEFFGEHGRVMAAVERALARALSGAVSPGAAFDGLMEAADAVRGLKLTLALMQAQAREWHAAGYAAGYAARDAGLRAGQEAQDGETRRGLALVRTAS